MKPRIALIPGDPSGIGPELVAKLLAEPGLSNEAVSYTHLTLPTTPYV